MADDDADGVLANVGQVGPGHESTLGRSFVGLWGLLAIALYLVLFAVSDFYVLVKVWPPPIDSSDVLHLKKPKQDNSAVATVNATPQESDSSNEEDLPQDAGTNSGPQYWKSHFFWCDAHHPCWISLSTSLFLISLLSGALGSLLHSFRSVYWYVGNRKLIWSWAMMYVLLPFGGGILATIFYIIVRGGFMQSATLQNSSPFGFAALGALVGMFSEEAVKKLKQVAGTVFAAADAGKDHVAPVPATPVAAPKIISISRTTGAAGSDLVLTGTNFSTGAVVNIDGALCPLSPGIDPTATSISVVLPAHAAGAVDVEVVNRDGQKHGLSGGFTYV